MLSYIWNNYQKLEILEKNDELNASNEELYSAMDTIVHQNEQLEKKNKAVLDSINYAQRIQAAMLPSNEEIQKAFPQSFIFYKPCEIVSGDFYWLYDQDDFTILAVMDCTGHGVPGAFMSMIGHSLLDKVVKEYQVHSPDEILSILDKLVVEALQKEGETVMDGMDGFVAYYDKKNRSLQLAGAKSTAYLFENKEMTIVNGDYMHIAGYDMDRDDKLKKFTLHTFSIPEPAMLYLCTDGYQDQMGGEKGKKFMIKKFRNLLINLAEHSIEYQLEQLHETLEQWKGKEQQTDDILIVGIHFA